MRRRIAALTGHARDCFRPHDPAVDPATGGSVDPVIMSAARRAALGFPRACSPVLRTLPPLRTWLPSWAGRDRAYSCRHGAPGLRPPAHALRRARLACDLLHYRNGALAHERDGHRVGAHGVARDTQGGEKLIGHGWKGRRSHSTQAPGDGRADFGGRCHLPACLAGAGHPGCMEGTSRSRLRGPICAERPPEGPGAASHRGRPWSGDDRAGSARRSLAR
jgi:hypothetical protein